MSRPSGVIFSKIRAVLKNPTSKQFAEICRVVSFSSFFKPSKLGNCESTEEYNEVRNLMQQVNLFCISIIFYLEVSKPK